MSKGCGSLKMRLFVIFLLSILIFSASCLALESEEKCCVFSFNNSFSDTSFFCDTVLDKNTCFLEANQRLAEEVYYDEQISQDECKILCTHGKEYTQSLLKTVELEPVELGENGLKGSDEDAFLKSSQDSGSFVVVFLWVLIGFVVVLFYFWRKKGKGEKRNQRGQTSSKTFVEPLPWWLSPFSFSRAKQQKIRELNQNHLKKIKAHKQDRLLEQHGLKASRKNASALLSLKHIAEEWDHFRRLQKTARKHTAPKKQKK